MQAIEQTSCHVGVMVEVVIATVQARQALNLLGVVYGI